MAKTNEDFILEISERLPEIEILGTYTKATERIEVKCKSCDYVWSPLAYSLTQGKSCPHCSAKRGAANHSGKTARKTHEQFVAELAVVQPEIVVLGQYINGHTNIECLCNTCSHTWSTKPYSLMQNHGCPRCSKSGTSFMEQFIRLCFCELLGEKAVLSRDKSVIGMELDIYIPSLNVAVEPGNWYLHKRSISRDRIKRQKCHDCGIRLITIYDKYPSNQAVPFDCDCYVFGEDLNRADHKIIRELVIRILSDLSIDPTVLYEKWDAIEAEAYKRAKAKTHDAFIKEIEAINPNIHVLQKYTNANIRIRVKCNICGYEWGAIPASLLAGDGCKKCGTKTAHEKFIKDQKTFIDEVSSINPDIEIIGVYTGRHNFVQARCRICGHEWSPRASSLLRGSNHKGWQHLHAKIHNTNNIG